MRSKKISAQRLFLLKLTERVLSGGAATRRDAERIVSLRDQQDIFMLAAHANVLRNHFTGPRIQLCAIVNAKSGRCSEDCIFCAQSSHYRTKVRAYPLLAAKDIAARARAAREQGAGHFSIVTSGRGTTAAGELSKLCDCVSAIAQSAPLMPCASLGVLTKQELLQLREAGLRRYHHNLETARSHFGNICTTHSYEARVQTIRMAREAGLEVCAGGILGMGETPQQRIELAVTLRDLQVESVPLNFLNPIPGTPAARYGLLQPLEILAAISLFRFMLPNREIRICGGRETGLRTLQPLMYLAGASGTMIGNYLTTSGRDPAADVQEITDLGLSIERMPVT
jgi:biotin synthase